MLFSPFAIAYQGVKVLVGHPKVRSVRIQTRPPVRANALLGPALTSLLLPRYTFQVHSSHLQLHARSTVWTVMRRFGMPMARQTISRPFPPAMPAPTLDLPSIMHDQNSETDDDYLFELHEMGLFFEDAS